MDLPAVIEKNSSKNYVPFGHILSLLVEEMEIETPNLKRMFLLFNNQMNSSGKIENLDELIYCGSGKYCGIIRYFNLLEKEGMVKEGFVKRVVNEFYQSEIL
jgi:hypothetical protein